MFIIVLFIISGILALYLSFFCFDIITMLEYYKNTVYWFMVVSSLLWLIALIKAAVYNNSEQVDYLKIRQSVVGFFKNHWVALSLSLFFMILGTLSCKPDFRILADETNILSDSQVLYECKQCFTNISSYGFRSGEKVIAEAAIDKRPAFFPFLICIIHSLTGYRPENVFILNFITGFLSLFLLYYLIQLLFGKYWGINGLICLSSYPLFIVYTNSGGFDIFNMMCSLVFFICLYKFIKTPKAIWAEVLLLWVPLFSQSRYESVLSLLIALPILFYYLPKHEYSQLGVGFVVTPLLFIAPAWLRLLTGKASEWQVDKGESVFSLEWFWENLKKAAYFFTAGDSAYGVIPLLSFLAFIGLIIFVSDIYFKKKSEIIEKSKELSSHDYRMFWVSVFALYFLHAVAKFSYKLTDLTEILATRHAIIFMPLFVIMAVGFLYQCNLKYSFNKLYCSAFFLILFLFYWPLSANSCCGVNNTQMYLDFKEGREFLKTNYPDKEDYLIIYKRSNFYTPLGYNSVSYNYYEKEKISINNLYKNKYYSYFLVFQRVKLDNNDSEIGLSEDNSLASKQQFNNAILNNFNSKKVFDKNLGGNLMLQVFHCIPKEIDLTKEK